MADLERQANVLLSRTTCSKGRCGVSIRSGSWWRRQSGPALEANRFARDYGITHQPAPAAEASVRACNDVGRAASV
jgi:hypothetical protein